MILCMNVVTNKLKGKLFSNALTYYVAKCRHIAQSGIGIY